MTLQPVVAFVVTVTLQEATLTAVNNIIKELKEELAFVKEQDSALSKV